MPRLIPDPELDEDAKVGLSFITIGYGVALVGVFPVTRLSQLGVTAGFHLALAAFMLVISYMGYYSNRQRYPAWRVKFFNVPLWQYLISFAILFLYWELGLVPDTGGARVTPTPEGVIVALVFALYWIWDCLEVMVQENHRYLSVLAATPDAELPPLASGYRQGAWPWKGKFRVRPGIGRRAPPDPRFARDVRASRMVTFAFGVLYLLVLVVEHYWRLHGAGTVAALDTGYIATLFLYRYGQWWWPLRWYHRAGV